MVKKIIPAISIIIPMYNVEKYIGECLDSILAQTFTDYEVIVVNDCSTDNSVAIVESYMPKFNDKGDRLKIVNLSVNSGGRVGIPRNIGINFSRGSYLYFVDSDDALLSNALEDMYALAEKFQSDIVYCERWYRVNDCPKLIDGEKVINGTTRNNPQPMFESEELGARLVDYSNKLFWGYPWAFLFRRDLIGQNDIKYPPVKIADDQFFTFCALCVAKKVLRVPNICYLYRIRDGGNSVESLTPDKHINRWESSAMHLFELLDKFLDRFELCTKDLKYKYMIFDRFFADFVYVGLYAKFSAYQFDKIIRRELADINDTTALTSYLFNSLNAFRLKTLRQAQIIKQQQEQIKQLQQQNHNVFSVT